MTDNFNLAAKLELRRHFLRKYHADGRADVLDCCQGGGVIWSVLRREFAVAGYFGVDVKPKKGRLRIDSVRLLQISGWRQNVIDVDTYGSPWKHWLSLLPNVRGPLTVFLTVGQRVLGTVGRVDSALYRAAGLVFPGRRLPAAFGVKLAPLLEAYGVGQAARYGVTVADALRADGSRNVHYLGLRLEKTENNT